MADLQYFDRGSEYWVKWRRLPHWTQPGTICFVTWRTADSMPKSVVARWHAERQLLLQVRGGVGRAKSASLGEPRLQWRLIQRWDAYLDECHGACWLKKPELAEIVADSLRYFDGKRYTLTDFVVMPNHVHLLAAFPDEASMLTQCHAWKRYSATQINRALGRSGEFWQVDSFDHLVRSEEQFIYLRRYIADNPRKAKLQPGEYRHESKPMP